MTNGEAITELHMLQCRFHQIRKSDAAWEAIEMAKDALLAREKSKDDLVKHGRWTFVAQRFYDGGYVDIFRCSCCGITEGKESKYCPNCGAMMEGGAEK